MHRASEIAELSVWQHQSNIHLATFKKMVRQAWRRQFGDICQSCNVRMHFEIRFRTHRHYATIDHIIARSLGGGDELENIQVICRDCNNEKSVIEYRQNPG